MVAHRAALSDAEELSDEAVAAMFASWDANGDGVLSLDEVVAGLKGLKLPVTPSDLEYYRERFRAADSNHDGRLQREELSLQGFLGLVREKERGLRAVFEALDTDKSGYLDESELRDALASLNMPYDEGAVRRLMRRIDSNGDGKISFSEFRAVLLLVPDYSLAAVMDYWAQAVVLNDDEGIAAPTQVPSAGREAAINSAAGGLASVLSKTSTAPIERLKILYQQFKTTPPSMIKTLQSIYAHEGVRGLFRGNLVNLAKSSPESAVKFAVFERSKQLLDPSDSRSLSALEMFLCGGAGGVAAHASCFPLEVLKTKIAGSPAGTYTSLAHCVSTVYRTEGGLRAFYRGLTPVLLSTIPHAGTTLSSYQISRDLLTEWSGEQHTPAWALVAAATASTVCGTTVATPLHVIKTRIIMGQAPRGALALIADIWKHEGAAGFTRGFAPSMVKGVPAHVVSFGVFEFFRRQFGIAKTHKKKHGHGH